MLKKLLRYDLTAVWRIWWIAAVSVLGLSVISGFGIRLLLVGIESGIHSSVGFIQEIIFVSVGYVSVAVTTLGLEGFVILTEVLVFIRYYRNFFSDEGYLTFTLPVSRQSLYLSKTLSALIWLAASGFVTMVCLMNVSLIAPPLEQGNIMFNPVVFREVSKGLGEVFSSLGIGWSFLYVLEGFLLSFISAVFNVGLLQFCITFGSVIARRKKVLVSIGIYYGVVSVISAVISTLVFLSGTSLFPQLLIRFEGMTVTANRLFLAVLGLIICAVTVMFAMFFHFLTQDLLEKKLNLT